KVRADVKWHPNSGSPTPSVRTSIDCSLTAALRKSHEKGHAAIAPTSHRQHNLPEMLVLAHMCLRRRSLIEREAAVDREPELPRGHRLPQIGAHAAADLTQFLERAGTEGHPI